MYCMYMNLYSLGMQFNVAAKPISMQISFSTDHVPWATANDGDGESEGEGSYFANNKV